MKDRNKIPKEEKVRLVRLCLDGKISKRGGGRQAGVDDKTFSEWIVQYEIEGDEAFMPREGNRVYSPETKLAAVKAYLDGGGSLSAICKKFKIRGNKLLQTWIKVYNAHGDLSFRKKSGGGSDMKQGRETTQAQRVEIAKACIASGKHYTETARKYNVSCQQVRNWTLRFEAMGEEGLEDRRGKRKKDQTPRNDLEKAKIEIEKLKHQLYLMEMERDFLKKLRELERGNASHK